MNYNRSYISSNAQQDPVLLQQYTASKQLMLQPAFAYGSSFTLHPHQLNNNRVSPVFSKHSSNYQWSSPYTSADAEDNSAYFSRSTTTYCPKYSVTDTTEFSPSLAHSMNHNLVLQETLSPAIEESSQVAPIDLSSKSVVKAMHLKIATLETVGSSSKLEALLTGRKRNGDCNHTKNSANHSEPLNLSKKRRGVDHGVDHGEVVLNIKDIVDNPVQFIQLTQASQADVQQNLSKWLFGVVHQAYSLPQFISLSQHDKVFLLLNSWHRLLLWVFAQTSFSFDLTRAKTSNEETASCCMSKPSMAFVKSISNFIDKFKTLNIDNEEFCFLFSITLFHNGHHVCSARHDIEKYKKEMMKKLQEYVMKKGGGIARYSQLLLYLPLLYGVNEKMFERLFCKHLTQKVDMKVFLKEIMNQISTVPTS